MPKGDEEEIAGRGEGFFRFVALLAPRALLERPTLNPFALLPYWPARFARTAHVKPVIDRDQLRPDGECSLDRLAQMLGALPRTASIRESCRGCTSPI